MTESERVPTTPPPVPPWYRHWWVGAAAVAVVAVVVAVLWMAVANGRKNTKKVPRATASAPPSTSAAPAVSSPPVSRPPVSLAPTPTVSTPPAQAPVVSLFPTSVSANHRYLLDQNGDPYPMLGDSPWALSTKLNTADMEYYFADRQAKGFNTALVGLLVDAYIGGPHDLSTFDGLYPFTSGKGTSSDLATPNPAYWSRMDTMVQTARNHGITLMLAPAETGELLPLLSRNGVTKDFNYGAFLGNRYKNDPNIIWISGNDYQTANWGNDPFVTAIAKGIRSTDSNHVQTVELGYPSSTSFDDPNWRPLINLNAAYTYLPTYDEVLKAYNDPNPDPVFMAEANYEFENNTGGPATTNETLRRQEYWSLTSGATAGQLYGNHFTWTLPSDWKSRLDTRAVEELGHMQNLVKSLAWYNLVPDQTHSLLTAGYGTRTTTGDVLESDYATAASTSDGTLAVIYTPVISALSIDLSKFRGTVTARWYDPTSGTFSSANGSPLPNAGVRQFKPAGRNGEGGGDWVLLLQAA